MKKTLLASLAAVPALAMYASDPQPVTLSICSQASGDELYKCTTTIDKVGEGSYTVADVFETGMPLSFSFEDATGGNPQTVDFNLGGNYSDDVNRWILDAQGTARAGKLRTDDSYATLSRIGIPDGMSMVYVNDTDGTSAECGGFDYCAAVKVALEIDGKWDNAYHTMYIRFNNPDNAEEFYGDMTVSVEVYKWSPKFVKYKSYDTTLTRHEDGTYTLADVMHTGYPLHFSYGEFSEQPNSDGYYEASATILSDVLEINGIKYMKGADGEAAPGSWTVDEEGAETEILKWIGFYAGYWDVVKDADGNIYFESYMSGSGEDGWTVYPYISFILNDYPSAGVGPVIGVGENADAPVEYYNLQGVRVEHPSHGIYVRRQGSKAMKVVVK